MVIVAVTGYVLTVKAELIGNVHELPVISKPLDVVYKTLFTITERVCPLIRVAVPVIVGVVSVVFNRSTTTGP